MRRVGIVEGGDLLADRYFRMIKRRDGGKQVPQIFVSLVIEHPSAANNIAMFLTACTVVASSKNVHFFDDMNAASRKIAIPNEKSGSRK
ncbi:hypothetical protein D3C73_1202220 [compost metagenome]